MSSFIHCNPQHVSYLHPRQTCWMSCNHGWNNVPILESSGSKSTHATVQIPALLLVLSVLFMKRKLLLCFVWILFWGFCSSIQKENTKFKLTWFEVDSKLEVKKPNQHRENKYSPGNRNERPAIPAMLKTSTFITLHMIQVLAVKILRST